MSGPVLVTGCNGTVGRCVTQALLASGRHVVGASLESACALRHQHLEYVRLDITDETTVARVLRQHRFDAILHLAALVHVRHKDLGFADYNRVNHRASEYLFETAATQSTDCKFLFTSTIEVYGATPARCAVDETALCRPESDYARTKLLAEEALVRTATHASSHYAVLRLAPVYAADFTLNIDKRLYLKRPIGYYLSRGEYRLALCSVLNISHFVVNWLSREQPTSGLFNVADAVTYSAKDLLHRERLAGRCKLKLQLPYSACLAGVSLLQTALSMAGRDPGMLSVGNLHKLMRSASWDTRRAASAVGVLPWNIDNTPGVYGAPSESSGPTV